MNQVYRFNRPISLLFLLPMILLVVMLTAGLLREFSVLPLVLVLLSLGVVGMVIYYSVLRSLAIGPHRLVWKAPGAEMSINMEDIRHFGIVKYRSFRFIYLSRSETPPFEKVDARIVTSEDTFVIQYREKAWQQAKSLVQAIHPDLKPDNFERGR